MRTLSDWLAYQSQLHAWEIDLGLDRVRLVWERMALPALPPIITVGGTNGKGSTLQYLNTALIASGFRVGLYTSPHLLVYNERVRICGEKVADDLLCRAFEKIEAARGEVALTYFEFGTLAAMQIFSESALDVLLLEVGLGGRLDAVNLFDPAVSLITNVGMDHMDWLGPDLESIGREKAGIFRAGKPAVVGMANPPLSLLRVAEEQGALLYLRNRDFGVEMNSNSADGIATWNWYSRRNRSSALPYPAMPGMFQLDNAAAAWMALEALGDQWFSESSLRTSLKNARLMGRMQLIAGPVERIFDVAHNEPAAKVVAEYLMGHPCVGKTIAVFAMLQDKDAAAVIAQMKTCVDTWIMAPVGGTRGRSGADLLAIARAFGISGKACETIALAWQEAEQLARPGDRIIAFGSFYLVEEALRAAHILEYE